MCASDLRCLLHCGFRCAASPLPGAKPGILNRFPSLGIHLVPTQTLLMDPQSGDSWPVDEQGEKVAPSSRLALEGKAKHSVSLSARRPGIGMAITSAPKAPVAATPVAVHDDVDRAVTRATALGPLAGPVGHLERLDQPPVGSSSHMRQFPALSSANASGGAAGGAAAAASTSAGLQSAAADGASRLELVGRLRAYVVATPAHGGALDFLLATLLLDCLSLTSGGGGSVAGGVTAQVATPPRLLALWETPFVAEFLGDDKILRTWSSTKDAFPSWQIELAAALRLLAECAACFGVRAEAKPDVLVMLLCYLHLSS